MTSRLTDHLTTRQRALWVCCAFLLQLACADIRQDYLEAKSKQSRTSGRPVTRFYCSREHWLSSSSYKIELYHLTPIKCARKGRPLVFLFCYISVYIYIIYAHIMEIREMTFGCCTPSSEALPNWSSIYIKFFNLCISKFIWLLFKKIKKKKFWSLQFGQSR